MTTLKFGQQLRCLLAPIRVAPSFWQHDLTCLGGVVLFAHFYGQWTGHQCSAALRSGVSVLDMDVGCAQSFAGLMGSQLVVGLVCAVVSERTVVGSVVAALLAVGCALGRSVLDAVAGIVLAAVCLTATWREVVCQANGAQQQ